MNGVAKKFWSEVYDLRAPIADDARRPRTSRSKRKAVRKIRAREADRAA